MSTDDFNTAEQPYFEEWSGGAPGSGNGATLYFPLSILEGHTLAAVYFRGMENNVARFISNDKKMLISRFMYPSVAYNMSADPKEEYGNTVPNYEEIPFELKNDQAVIAFEANGKMKYVKLENLTQKETVAYPSAPPQGQ
ncbi:membrane or secreted protein [Nonlabens dokdonensis DSW-6]|uniref:Membrane or secreted protein n=2 Tax=Nonlabens dokdonensis TaxID=328515 RepID=L7W8W8_NONDD|nr:membrane or secreted protein [Nonlabens dokdonensis DSW-6]